MKRRDLEQHLRAHGATLLREGGNHSFWGFEAERSTAVPRHREIAYALARKICKDLSIPPPNRLSLTRANYLRPPGWAAFWQRQNDRRSQDVIAPAVDEPETHMVATEPHRTRQP